MNFNENERLRALKEYIIIDTQNEKVFDEITKLLSQICETEIALISFVDKDRHNLEVLNALPDFAGVTNRFETLTKIAPVGIFMTTAKGVPTYFNDQWYKVAGITKEQAFSNDGFGSFDVYHPDDLERVIESWFNATQEKRSLNEEFRLINKLTGRIHYIKATAHPLFDTNNEVTGYIGATLDLTKEKSSEKQSPSSWQI